jgi:hypothetical protein
MPSLTIRPGSLLVRYYEQQGFTRGQTFSVAQGDRDWPGQIMIERLN